MQNPYLLAKAIKCTKCTHLTTTTKLPGGVCARHAGVPQFELRKAIKWDRENPSAQAWVR